MMHAGVFSVYSIAISVVFYNLALIAVFVLRRSPGFRAKYTMDLLLVITVLGVLRLVVPFDFDKAYVVRSYKIIPAVEDFLRRPLFGSFRYGHLLLAVWAIGSIVTAVRDIHIRRKFERSLRRAKYVDKPEVLAIAAEFGGDFAVLILPKLDTPYTTGTIHPVIYLPDIELSDEEWRLVFRHEVMHVRSRDNLKKFFFLAVKAIFWWNPLAYFSGAEIDTLLELRCDEKVTAKMDSAEQTAYIALLLKFMAMCAPKKLPAAVSGLASKGSEEMRLRFEALNKPGGRRSRLSSYILLAVLVLVFISSFFVIVQPARMPGDIDIGDIGKLSEADYTISYTINSEDAIDSMYLIYDGGIYRLYQNNEYMASLQEDVIKEPPYNTVLIIGGN